MHIEADSKMDGKEVRSCRIAIVVNVRGARDNRFGVWFEG